MGFSLEVFGGLTKTCNLTRMTWLVHWRKKAGGGDLVVSLGSGGEVVLGYLLVAFSGGRFYPCHP